MGFEPSPPNYGVPLWLSGLHKFKLQMDNAGNQWSETDCEAEESKPRFLLSLMCMVVFSGYAIFPEPLKKADMFKMTVQWLMINVIRQLGVANVSEISV